MIWRRTPTSPSQHMEPTVPVTYIKPGEPWPGGHPHATPTILFNQKPKIAVTPSSPPPEPNKKGEDPKE